MESHKNKVYAIEKAVYTGELDILEFTFSGDDKSYYNYYSDSRHKKIREKSNLNLLMIKDLFLRRRIVEFLYYCMDPHFLNPNSFCDYRVMGLRYLLIHHPGIFEMAYDDFKLFMANEFNELSDVIDKSRAFINTFRRYCDEQDYKDNPFLLDYWDISRFKLAKERNYASRHRYLFFDKIQDEHNRYLVKKYIEYCLTNTDNSISTILGKITSLKELLNLIDAPFDEWEADDAEQFVIKLNDKYANKQTLASRMIIFQSFADYLLVHDYIDDNPVKKYRHLARIGTFKHNANSVDHSVVLQIFNALHNITDKRLVICFLLLYCVGMRVSEACCIKTDCTEKTEKGTFVKYYSLKMKKEVYNVIPTALYEMIEELKAERIGEEYLFESNRLGIPMSSSFFSDKLNQEFTESGVSNPDGTPYRFTPHSFRHLMAVRMRENEIPFQFIQEQLHHVSPEMTLAYIEYLDRVKIDKMDKFIDSSGNYTKGEIIADLTADEEYADYMRKHINAQMLPDGICARPIKLGKCSHANACLTCPDFRTSVRYLDIHRKHLESVEQYINTAKENGWLPQVESNQLIMKTLKTIIEKLEEAGGDES